MVLEYIFCKYANMVMSAQPKLTQLTFFFSETTFLGSFLNTSEWHVSGVSSILFLIENSTGGENIFNTKIFMHI